jgi:hypothetical protein
LAGIHAAAEFIARGPEGRIEVRFLDGHSGIMLLERSSGNQSGA